MPYNGSGTFSVYTPGTPYVTGTVISSSIANSVNTDFATGLSTAICKDGQTTITANLPLNSFKLTGLGNGSAATDSTAYGQLGLTLISSVVASSSATIDFTSGITSAYDEYLIVISDVTPATDGVDFWLRISEDSGANWKSGGSDYGYSQFVGSSNGPSTAQNTSTGDTKIVIAKQVSNGNVQRVFACEVRLNGLSGTSRGKPIYYAGGYLSSVPSYVTFNGYGQYISDTSAINGIRFLMSSGNIATGNFYLFGRRKI